VIIYCCFNREKVFGDSDMSAIEIFSELLSSLMFRIILNEKILEKQCSFDTLISESILGVISISDNKITFINNSALNMLNLDIENCMNKNASNVLNVFPAFERLEKSFMKNKRCIKTKLELEIKGIKRELITEIKPIALNDKKSSLITLLDHENCKLKETDLEQI